jgi:tetratricopeptide (TPR) repeat protein
VDPPGYVRVAAFESEILLDTGASPGEVVAATAGAVALIEAWGLTGVFAEGVVADVGWAHLRAGDVEAAHRAVASKVDASGLFYMMQIQTVWCAVQVARGEVEAAVARLEAMFSLDNYATGAARRDHVRAGALLWSGRAAEAIECLDRALGFVCANDLSRESAALFATRARAAADHVDATGAGVDGREAAARLVDQLRRSSRVDPFGPAGLGADRDAHAAQWDAELARIQHRDHAEHWNRAAASFDALGRPHDAAYCRWRAAQCALRDGQGTVAARLLKKAAAEAREHVPLSEAIAATRAGAA